MLLQEVVVVVLVVVVVFPVEGVVDLTGTPGTMMLLEMRMVFLEDTDLLKMLMEQGVVVLLVDTVLAVVVEVAVVDLPMGNQVMLNAHGGPMSAEVGQVVGKFSFCSVHCLLLCLTSTVSD